MKIKFRQKFQTISGDIYTMKSRTVIHGATTIQLDGVNGDFKLSDLKMLDDGEESK